MQLNIQMWTSQWKWDWIGQILIMCGIDNSLLVSMDGQNKIRENNSQRERKRERVCVTTIEFCFEKWPKAYIQYISSAAFALLHLNIARRTNGQ